MPAHSEASEYQLKTVVYATDFSLCSQNAGLYAARLAAYFSSSLLVAHAFTLTQPAMEVEIDHTLVSQQRKDLSFLLSRKASLLTSDTVHAIPTLLEGDPVDVIPALAEEHKPALLVLGTHGGGWVERGLIGSVAEHILRSAQWPCLTVGPQVPPAKSQTIPFDRILYVTDFTAASARAAVHAASFATVFKATIEMLHVVPNGALEDEDRLQSLRDKFDTALHSLSPQLRGILGKSGGLVEVGDANSHILELIRTRSIDLVVLGIQKNSYFGVEMRESQAFQIILNAHCPVLTIVG